MVSRWKWVPWEMLVKSYYIFSERYICVDYFYTCCQFLFWHLVGKHYDGRKVVFTCLELDIICYTIIFTHVIISITTLCNDEFIYRYEADLIKWKLKTDLHVTMADRYHIWSNQSHLYYLSEIVSFILCEHDCVSHYHKYYE